MGFLEIKGYGILTRQNAKFAHKHLNREPIRGGFFRTSGGQKLIWEKIYGFKNKIDFELFYDLYEDEINLFK